MAQVAVMARFNDAAKAAAVRASIDRWIEQHGNRIYRVRGKLASGREVDMEGFLRTLHPYDQVTIARWELRLPMRERRLKIEFVPQLGMLEWLPSTNLNTVEVEHD